MKELGHEGLVNMLAAYEDKTAQAVCTFAYCHGPGKEPILFQGRTDVWHLFQAWWRWAFVGPISDIHRARLFPHAARRDSVLIASSSLNYLVCERGNPRVLIQVMCFRMGSNFRVPRANVSTLTAKCENH